MAKQFDMDKFNRILKDCGQIIQATNISTTDIVFSNGLILTTEQEVRTCKRRVMTGDTVWKENFDSLYGIDSMLRGVTEQQCKSIISARGGNNCQLIHGHRIQSNLNNGIPWNKGTKGNYPYSNACTEETKQKISDSNKGEKNGMFGVRLSAEQRQHKSNVMKEMILSGKFTPNSNNRNTHWESFFKNKKYRSSWEALYQSIDNDAEYETLRIPYQFDNKEYIYIVDFVNHKTKTVIEVKPIELTHDNKTQKKINTAKKWCDKNEYQFILADLDYLCSYKIPMHLDDFDEKTQIKIKKLYETR